LAVHAIGEVASSRSEQARMARLARAVALFSDLVVFGGITFVVNSVYGLTQVSSGSFGGSTGFTTFSTVTVVPWPVLSVIGLAYFMVPEALFGASPGKGLARLKVVKVDGTPLTVGSVVVRNVLKLVDWLPLLYLAGGVCVLVTRNSQRLGDLVAGTTVVYRHHALEPGATRSATVATRRVLMAALAIAIIFTAGFDYFGRPPLVIQGMFNTHTYFPDGTSTYALGPAQWSQGSVTYPVTTRGDIDCTGTITLQWQTLGWDGGGDSLRCGAYPIP
jgi:uncharacterized RDD family membrane protein YckC